MPTVDIDNPRWDQSTYSGRAKHFFATTNPLNLFQSNAELANAKDTVDRVRKGKGTDLSEEEIWRAKHIYDSAFHPDTGQKMPLIGRMSAQVPMNMILAGGLLTFYKTNRQVVFWQWLNQSFNALVNYTNRSGDSPISFERLGMSYFLATSGALATALGLKRLVKHAPPLISRFVPFCAISAATCVNIPMMRMQELQQGIPVEDKNGESVGNSKIAATWAIYQVIFSRIVMSMPGMLVPPMIMNRLEKKGTLKRHPWISAPLQVALCGVLLVFATPLCCALFPQKSSIPMDSLEPEIRKAADKLKIKDEHLQYNKGL